ncbi:MAG TPA: UDP-N-acetylmuramoyl-L-alanine--D-glutamate ligase [Solirubrobacteraceae bacterium]|nr:UDP-N-acetylmuramoyl-L-alanine--D-glutamate ligase [Solirubrobacteraceae bacterium]
MKPRPLLPSGPFLVVGLARSGVAAALALAARGERVIGCDSGPATKPELAEAEGRLEQAGVEVHLDASGDALAARAGTLIKSPGVPQDAPAVVAARNAGVPVLGELELAWRMLPNDFLAVTGTNGKTTTTEWIGHIHRAAGWPVAVAGNVGTALSGLVGEVSPEATIVCEASSFQLEDTEAFAPEAATLLNLSPDHLDRHGTFEAYVQAKLRVFAHQGPSDVAVLPDALEIEVPGEARLERFGAGESAGLRFVDGQLHWHGDTVVDVAEIRLPGLHNLENAMAAATVCLSRGLGPAAVAEGLRTFHGVAHRLELIANFGGVAYVNDSKATNVASTLVALRSYEQGVHLILGGLGKSQDFSPLAPVVAERCAAVYLIGQDAPLIESALRERISAVPLRCCHDLAAAVESAREHATPGDVVLLSPACASFDQYPDFEARGEHFRALVLAAAGPSEADA